jgi:hypothetical protein
MQQQRHWCDLIALVNRLDLILISFTLICHRGVLYEEQIASRDRAKWKMKMFGKKKSSIARAARRLIEKAVTNPRTGRRFPISRPLLIALGHATFPSGGPGEIFVPVKKIERAIHRACKEEMATTQRVVVIHPVS